MPFRETHTIPYLVRYLKGTFVGRLEDRCWFGRQQNAVGVLAERSVLVIGHNELADESRAVSDVIVLVIFPQVQNVLGQQLSLDGRKEGEWGDGGKGEKDIGDRAGKRAGERWRDMGRYSRRWEENTHTKKHTALGHHTKCALCSSLAV